MKYLAMTLVILSGGIVAGAGADDARITRLSNIINSYPDPSPAGDRIVFQSNRTGEGQIYVMDADGTNIRQLTDVPLGAETPVWSPDGKSIAYAAYLADGNNDVFVMDKDGDNKRQITDGPGYDGHPHWSFDGKRIVFNSDRTTPDRNAAWSDRWHEIFSANADGTDIRQHTQCKSVCTYGSLSPAGDRILYRKTIDSASFSWSLQRGTRNSEVFVARTDGTDEINLSANTAFDGWPVWAPDGSRIAFASNRAGPARVGHIYTINPDGTELRQITTGSWSYTQPAWSKNSASLFANQSQETADYEFGDIVRIEFGDSD